MRVLEWRHIAARQGYSLICCFLAHHVPSWKDARLVASSWELERHSVSVFQLSQIKSHEPGVYALRQISLGPIATGWPPGLVLEGLEYSLAQKPLAAGPGWTPAIAGRWMLQLGRSSRAYCQDYVKCLQVNGRG